jgi:hypothetical protein
MKNTFAVFTLLFMVPVAANDHVTIVKEAFSNISNDYHQEWAFTQSTLEDDVLIVQRYDPRSPDDHRWKLITVDGRVPTVDEIAEYQDDEQDDFHDNDNDDDSDMVNFETLSLIEETNEYWLFQFTPDVGDDEDETGRKFMQQVDGTIRISRDGNYVSYIDLRNVRPIRPAFSVKISSFSTHLTFGPAGDGGPVVPLSIDVAVKGRAMLFVTFDELESIRYSDYENVGISY